MAGYGHPACRQVNASFQAFDRQAFVLPKQSPCGSSQFFGGGMHKAAHLEG